MAYSIDGGAYKKFNITGTGKMLYTLETGLTAGYHTIDVVKVTESVYLGGIVTFYGFEYFNGYATSVEEKDRSIWFIGDSITAGFGVEGANTNGSFTLSEENVTKTYGFKTATALNAKYRATAVSGGGLVKDVMGGSMVLPSKINLVHNSSAYANTQMCGYEEPDVIVVNLGANDFNNQGVAEEYIAGYHKFIDNLRKKCPNAKIVCAINSYYTDAVSAVTRVVNEELDDGYTDISLCVMQMENTGSYLGAASHPNEKGHTALSNSLITHIKQLMNW